MRPQRIETLTEATYYVGFMVWLVGGIVSGFWFMYIPAVFCYIAARMEQRAAQREREGR